MCHTFCVILPDFQRKLHPCFVSYTFSHTLFYSDFFCHTLFGTREPVKNSYRTVTLIRDLGYYCIGMKMLILWPKSMVSYQYRNISHNALNSRNQAHKGGIQVNRKSVIKKLYWEMNSILVSLQFTPLHGP